ncbi:hypothetical protein [Streptococcus suis]
MRLFAFRNVYIKHWSYFYLECDILEEFLTSSNHTLQEVAKNHMLNSFKQGYTEQSYISEIIQVDSEEVCRLLRAEKRWRKQNYEQCTSENKKNGRKALSQQAILELLIKY